MIEIISSSVSSTMIGVIALPLLVICGIYLVYRYGIREKSFEEAIEEQKRRSLEEEMQQKLGKTKKEKKFKKNWGKKSKEKVEQIIPLPPVQVEEKAEVPAIEIIEPKEVKSTKQKNKVKGNINVNNKVVPEVVPTEKPKIIDVLEKPVDKKKDDVPAPVKEPENVSIEEPIAETPVIDVAPVQTTSTPPSSSGKKKKKEHVEKENIPPSTSKLLSLIKDAALDAEEVQTFVEILLNKQKESAKWTKKNDQLASTKKNLSEKEQQLDMELKKNQAVTSKLKDLREEHNQLKSKLSSQEKLYQEKISRHQQEIQTLTVRVKQLLEQMNAEKEKSSEIEKVVEKKMEVTVKKLEEEKAKLQQKLSKLESESRSGVSKPEFDALKKSREDLQKVHNLLIEQHTQLVTSHKSDLKNLHAQISDAKAQVEEANAKNMVLLKEIETLKETKSALESVKIVLEDQIKLDNKRCSELEAQVQCLTVKITDFSQLQTELKNLRLENERLAEQLVSTKERVAGDGQEIVHQNGELNGKVQDEILSKSLNEKENLLKEKEAILNQMKEDLNKEKAKISVLSEELEAQKQKNNELREKNWKAVDALRSAEQRLQEIQTAADDRVAETERSWEEKLRLSTQNTASSNSTQDLENRLKEAEDKLAQRLADYNSQVEKNKILQTEVERITALYESSTAKVIATEESLRNLRERLAESETKTREALQRICPEISIDSSLPYDAWLSEYEKQAVLTVQNVTSKSDSHEIEARYQQLLLEKDNELTEKQAHYEKLLAETESTLIKLQKSAEAQEAVWIEKMNEKEQQIEKMEREKESLAGHIGALAGEKSALNVSYEALVAERDALIAERSSVQSAFQSDKQLEELQERLMLTKKTLENLSTEKQYLEQKYDEVNKNCINLRDQLENKEKQILELQKESTSLDSFRKEIDDLKSKLEKEKKINKDFSSQMIKLNSLVKIGQDALTQEQEMVKKLKNQLENTQVSTANGTASATTVVSSPVISNEDVSAKK